MVLSHLLLVHLAVHLAGHPVVHLLQVHLAVCPEVHLGLLAHLGPDLLTFLARSGHCHPGLLDHPDLLDLPGLLDVPVHPGHCFLDHLDFRGPLGALDYLVPAGLVQC